MDLATLLGLIGGMIVITLAVLSGSDVWMFVNLPGVMIVFGGTAAATLIKFPIADCFSAFAVGIKTAFFNRGIDPQNLITKAHHLANIARRDGLLPLQDEVIDNAFFKKGIQMAVDGQPPEFVEKVLNKEKELSIDRHQQGEKIFRAMGESAPAFGMIGTLVGLVQMLSNLNDPSSLGPGMAVALLTTLYGALIANLVALPIAEKLLIRAEEEYVNKSLITEMVLGIQQGQSPRVMDELLETFLSEAKRRKMNRAAAATSPPKGEVAG